jgi:hypothetical protein
MMRKFLIVACFMIVASPVFAIAPGQVDDFENGTEMDWAEGFFSPNPPGNIPTGGPAGNGDAYIQNVSTGQFSTAGGRMVMFNQIQWAGNYVSAGVASIRMQVANFGATPLTIRIAIQGGSTRYGSTNGFALPADGVWREATFNLNADGMSLIAGVASLNTVLSNVSTLRIMSRASGPGWEGDTIAGTLGVDNITATAPSAVGEGGRSIVTALANAPNPFTRVTTIRYRLAEASPVSIEIFDLAGRAVRVLESSAEKPAGDYEATWDGAGDRGAPAHAGIYFYRVTANGAVHTRKMVLIRD